MSGEKGFLHEQQIDEDQTYFHDPFLIILRNKGREKSG